MAALVVASSGSSVLGSPIFWALAALFAGLLLFWRGLVAYRRRAQVAGIGTSRIASVAVGEARLVGTIRAAETLLASPSGRIPCVYYRTSIETQPGPEATRHTEILTSSTSFFLEDGSGSIRVFPRDASWDVPGDFVHPTPPGDTEPVTEAQRQAAVGRLLTVQAAPPSTLALMGSSLGVDDRVSVNETWLQPRDPVTVIGTVLPYGELDDAFGTDPTSPGGEEDPVVAEEVAEARAAGLMADSPEEAWGNAAIPGFGIGRPIRPPVLDPAVPVPPAARAAPAAAVSPSVASGGAVAGGTPGLERLVLDPQTPVLAAGPGHPLSVFAGTPGQAIARAETAFVVGAFGAILAMGAAAVLLYLLSGAHL